MKRLAVLLFVAGLITRSFFNLYGNEPTVLKLTPYFSVAVAQLMLLGIWCALSPGRAGRRVMATLAGFSLLWLISFYDGLVEWWTYSGSEPFIITFLGLAIPLLSTTLALAVLRAIRWRIARVKDLLNANFEPLQFGLRQLFIATTVAAVMLMGARGMRSFYAVSTARHEEGLRILVFSLVLAVSYPSVAVAAVAAGLATRHVGIRLAVVALTAATAAAFPLLIVPFDEMGATLYVATTLIGTSMVVAALWVVRRSGYRIVRKTTQDVVSYLNPPAT